MYSSLGSSGPPSRSARPKKERKVSVILRSGETGQHSGGLTSLALSESGDRVFTASRDFNVKRWIADGHILNPEATFEGHTDWVNDVAVVGNDVLASASADHSVRLWKASSQGQASYVLLEHEDHVTALAAAPASGLMVSGGLSSELFLWDVPTATRLQSPAGYRPHPAPGLKDSVYSVALNIDGSVVASGSPEGFIRITDPRMDRKVAKLRGHTANVRALALNEAGTLCVSGSMDHTIRVWDVGQQRCVSTLAVHEDSVWSVAVDAAFSTVTSGGRDGCIYRTNVAKRTSELVARELGPVRRVAAAPDGVLWSASEGVGLAAWPTTSGGGKLPPPRSRPGSGPGSPRGSHAGLRPGPGGSGPSPTRPRGSLDAGSSSTATAAADAASPRQRRPVPGTALPVVGGHSPGKPGSSGRPAATLSPKGASPQGSPMQTASSGGLGGGGNDVPQLAHASPPQQLQTPDSGGASGSSFIAAASPAMRARQAMEIGSPVPLLRHPLCAARPMAPLREAATLQDQRHIATRDADGKLALWDVTTGSVVRWRGQGQLADVLRDMFEPVVVAPWFTVDVSSGKLTITLDPMQPSTFSAEVYASELGHMSAPVDQRLVLAEQMVKGLFWSWAQKAGHAAADACPALDPHRQHGHSRGAFEFWDGSCQPIVASTDAAGKPWRRLAGHYDGSETPGEVVPYWVAEVVLNGRLPARPDDKCAFNLQPAQGLGLPPLAQARLNAPAIMRVSKIAPYALTKLEDAGVSLLPALPVHLDPVLQQQRAAQQPTPGGRHLELTCLGQAVPDELSLAALKKFIWQRKDEIVVEYRILDPTHPAPLPVVEHPSA